jgi:hypothetical protein
MEGFDLAGFRGQPQRLGRDLQELCGVRYIVAWKLCATMGAEDVTATLDLALSAAGLDLISLSISSSLIGRFSKRQ